MTVDRVRALLSRPVVVAPMGGGPTTPALVAAAAEAGALGFLASGYKTADAMKAEMDVVRGATSGAFGVNVFVPGAPSPQPEPLMSYLQSLAEDASGVGAALGEPTWDDDDWAAKITALVADPPALVSFTFDCPSREIVHELRSAGSVVAATVTNPQEAVRASSTGVDCLCVQGIEAGAHRGTFINDDRALRGAPLLELVDAVARVTDLPQIATGGIMGANDVSGVLAAGAVAAQCGTAFLCCPESGTHPAHQAALGDPRFTSTALTRAFTGRPARGLVNRFMLDHPDAPPAYPEINNATRLLRAAAGQRGDSDWMSLWAGTGYRQATIRPAGEIIELLSSAVQPNP
jgi:nitronate monooxygenase